MHSLTKNENYCSRNSTKIVYKQMKRGSLFSVTKVLPIDRIFLFDLKIVTFQPKKDIKLMNKIEKAQSVNIFAH